MTLSAALASAPSIARRPPSPPKSQTPVANQRQLLVTLSNPKPIPLSLGSSLTTPRAHHRAFPDLSHDPQPDSSSYAAAVESCDSVQLGIQIHAHALKAGFCGSREFLETKLLLMYGRCGYDELARELFENMPRRNIYSWAGIISVSVDYGFFEEALSLFKRLQFEDMPVEFFIFPVVLKACSGLGALELGRQLHGAAAKLGFMPILYIGNALIDMYGKCGSLDEAIAVSNAMPEKDHITWNSMITACVVNGMVYDALEVLQNMQLCGNLEPNLISWSAAITGFSQNGYDEEALELLYQMQDCGIVPNEQTLASVLPACARLGILNIGKEIHGFVIRHSFTLNAFIVNGLLDLYRKCGDMDSSLKIFSTSPARNLFSYITMIVGYCELGNTDEAKELFDEMELHGIKREIGSWNSIISGYVDNGQFAKALDIFKLMQTEGGFVSNTFTLGSALAACAGMGSLRHGKEIHGFAILRGLHSDKFVAGALVDVYCKAKDLCSAEAVFAQITEEDMAIWNALISGLARCNQIQRSVELINLLITRGSQPNIYTWNGLLSGCLENGHNESALKFFIEMQLKGIKPDIYSIGMVMSACTKLMMTELGKQAHAYLIRQVWDSDVHVGTALVDLYAKCGCIRLAEIAFYRISHPNIVAYNALLAGFAVHGLSKETISLFHKLLSDGLKPDEITFLSVLSSCTHEGVIEEGIKYFNLMQEFDMEPELKHYTCVVDLLSRSGYLDEAYKLIQCMHVEPDAVVWGAFLSGCVIYKNVELGEVAASRLLEVDPGNPGNYVMLANLYGAIGRQTYLSNVRQIIKNDRLYKIPGCSWIEDQNKSHIFVSGDSSHDQADEIYETVKKLSIHMGEK